MSQTLSNGPYDKLASVFPVVSQRSQQCHAPVTQRNSLPINAPCTDFLSSPSSLTTAGRRFLWSPPTVTTHT